MGDDLDAGLRAIFLEEFGEQLRAMSAELMALETAPHDAERARSLFRILHTLKGAAGAVGATTVAAQCHRLETALADADPVGAGLDQSVLNRMFAGLDTLAASRAQLVSQAPGTHDVPAETPAASSLPHADRSSAVSETVRVPLAKLESVLALSRQLEGVQARLQTSAGLAAALTGDDVGRPDHLDDLPGLARQLALDARLLRGMTDALSHHATELLMRPFRDAVTTLDRVVRDAGQSTGKHARLVIEGGDVEADRHVLDMLREVLPHLVRNAVDHGIEPSGQRRMSGKDEVGTITVAAAVRAAELHVQVSDDGDGVDTDALRQALRRRQRDVPEDPETLLAAIFESGLSTRTSATTTSGRGVGLDAVRSQVMRVGGSIRVESRTRSGTTFCLRTPLDLARMRALLVTTDRHLVAIPAIAVDRVIRIGDDNVRRLQERPVVTVPNVPTPVPLAALADVLALDTDSSVGHNRNAVVISAGHRWLALAVAGLEGEEEIIVHPARRLTDKLPYVSGVSMRRGRIAMVLNPQDLLERGLALPADMGRTRLRTGEPARMPRVLVVDDSVTTRSLHQRVLASAGYEIRTAVDGTDAIAALDDGIDAVVADVEMPRMDGFALCEAIRRSADHRNMPIVLVTSRDSEEFRVRGMHAGADAYLGKAGFDEAGLVATLRALLDNR